MSSALYRIEHETRYRHAGRASTSQHVAYLKPRELPRQRVRRHELAVEPALANRSQRTDFFGNTVDQFTILTPYHEMRAISRSLVEVVPPETAVDPAASEAWEAVRDALLYLRGAAYQDAAQFSFPSPSAAPGPELAAFALESFEPGRPLVAAAVDLMHRI